MVNLYPAVPLPAGTTTVAHGGGDILHADSGVHPVTDQYLAVEQRLGKYCPWMGSAFLRPHGSVEREVKLARSVCAEANVSLEKVYKTLLQCLNAVPPAGKEPAFVETPEATIKVTKSSGSMAWVDPFREDADATPLFSHEATLLNQKTGDLVYINPVHLRLIREREFFAGLDVHEVLHVLGILVRDNDPVQSILSAELSSELPVIEAEEQLGRFLNAYYYSSPEERAFFMSNPWSVSKALQALPTYKTASLDANLVKALECHWV